MEEEKKPEERRWEVTFRYTTDQEAEFDEFVKQVTAEALIRGFEIY